MGAVRVMFERPLWRACLVCRVLGVAAWASMGEEAVHGWQPSIDLGRGVGSRQSV